MVFNQSVSVGDIVSVGIVLVSAWNMLGHLRARLALTKDLERRLDLLERAVERCPWRCLTPGGE